MEILKLKKANCKNCYKCVRGCPVKAIEVKNHQAQVILQDCIYCGNCILVCPQQAKVVRSDIQAVESAIAGGKTVVASVAPAFIASYPVDGFDAFAQALRALGFAGAREAAEGAYLVKSRYEQLVRERRGQLLISSCCPTVVKLIQTRFPKALRHLAPVLSPMQAHAKLLKTQDPDAVVVFIGPCISKKDECEQFPDGADYALTFDELNDWMQARGISFPSRSAESAPRRSRFFPESGGILKSMKQENGCHYLAVDGLQNCMEVLEEIGKGRLSDCFVEMSACSGSCIGGPCAGGKKEALASRIRVEAFAGGGRTDDFDLPDSPALEKSIPDLEVICIPPSEQEITAILQKMGKHRPEDELNCGTCGYDTCREKAAAVHFGRAEISMCLPYMKERAESVSLQVIDAVPSAIVTVNTDLTIQELNRAAGAVFGLLRPQELIGAPVSRILNEFDFVKAITSESGRFSQKVFLPEYQKYLEQEFLYDKGIGICICIMKDVTEAELENEKIMDVKLSAARITDEIIEKQLRTVHEIASLLGETAAETQVALTDLKEAILLEGHRK
ncbi:[Fe-Fe] hydrogenase large subunit C-terminal domain-containing protein [Anaerotruncus rubiinfantis]|uniref:[Fe-Fe] hydrogenase large subunit C-terminal domain-containing protein n=1 Tax=Anaerotruncus rubiinfantis TaxID=1720200 RepID=UPI001899E8BD|nr:[Fe-Fe] hydrogenase large subunit C-terminal domain-containing protein [Anaerotruncus rubiinfantis]